jgi:plastocyanin
LIVATARSAAALLILAATLGAIGCEEDRPAAPPTSTPPASTPGSEQVEVRLTCSTGKPDAPCAFRPAEVTIRVGGTVRWVNDDATYHTITSTERAEVRRPSGRFDGVVDAPAEAFSISFTEPGTYPYYCQPHAEFMAGVVRVVAE